MTVRGRFGGCAGILGKSPRNSRQWLAGERRLHMRNLASPKGELRVFGGTGNGRELQSPLAHSAGAGLVPPSDSETARSPPCAPVGSPLAKRRVAEARVVVFCCLSVFCPKFCTKNEHNTAPHRLSARPYPGHFLKCGLLADRPASNKSKSADGLWSRWVPGCM